MKTIGYKLFIAIYFCFQGNNLFAQKVLNEATIVYDISIESTSPNEMSKAFQGAIFTVYVKAGKSKTVMQSSLGTESYLYDTKSEKGNILKEYSGQKLLIPLTKANWETRNQLFYNLKFDLKEDSKVINGYSSKKAAVISSPQNFKEIFYSTEFKLVNNEYNNALPGLPGIPVQYKMILNEVNFVYTLKTINYDQVSLSVFDLPTTGFRVIDYDAAKKIKAGE